MNVRITTLTKCFFAWIKLDKNIFSEKYSSMTEMIFIIRSIEQTYLMLSFCFCFCGCCCCCCFIEGSLSKLFHDLSKTLARSSLICHLSTLTYSSMLPVWQWDMLTVQNEVKGHLWRVRGFGKCERNVKTEKGSSEGKWLCLTRMSQGYYWLRHWEYMTLVDLLEQKGMEVVAS